MLLPQHAGPYSQNIGDTSMSHKAPRPSADVVVKPVDESTSDTRSQYRSWRASDHPVALGPEKAWSIDTGDSVAPQDGPVEKSITEALAGVEPTRSRKASHSLRFFKEGLPDEVAKKRDARGGNRLQHKLSPTQERPEGEECAADRVGENQQEQTTLSRDSVSRDPIGADASHAKSATHVEQPEPVADYFGSRLNGQSATRGPIEIQSLASRLAKASLEQLAGPKSSTQPSTSPEVHKVHRVSDASTERGEPTEECEDSSEEKISSAVFVPHQDPEESTSEVLPSDFVTNRPPTRRQSTKEDFHEWLVKADEIGATRQNKIDSPDATSQEPNAGRERNGTTTADECAIEDDEQPVLPTPGTITVSEVPQVNIPVEDDFVYEADPEPKQPLEAIELVPYKHQVGGHTTVWRFSKKAVCKQLNNRENEFYENIERYHRALLPFLPR